MYTYIYIYIYIQLYKNHISYIPGTGRNEKEEEIRNMLGLITITMARLDYYYYS